MSSVGGWSRCAVFRWRAAMRRSVGRSSDRHVGLKPDLQGRDRAHARGEPRAAWGDVYVGAGVGGVRGPSVLRRKVRGTRFKLKGRFKGQGTRFKLRAVVGGLIYASDAVRSSPHPTGTARTIRWVTAAPNPPYEFWLSFAICCSSSGMSRCTAFQTISRSTEK